MRGDLTVHLGGNCMCDPVNELCGEGVTLKGYKKELTRPGMYFVPHALLCA